MLAATADFVCAADEVWRLQRGSEPDCVFFQRTVNRGERITDKGSRQGFWVLSPGGVLLARANTRDTDRLLDMLATGRAAWDALPPEQRRLPAEAAESFDDYHRWEDGYPEDGLVLDRVGRELLPVPPAPGGDRSPRWNRDQAWFSGREIAALIPADAVVGDVLEWPLVAERLARFHLVDNVRGQTLPYAREELRDATLRAEVVGRRGALLELVLSGSTDAEAAPDWKGGDNLWKPRSTHPHGLQSVLTGTATWDAEAGRFVAFELLSVARRWGRTVMNGRGRDDAPGHVAFHLSLAPPGLPRVAPTFVAVYDVDWIPRPAVPTWLESPAECGLEVEGD